MLEENPKCQDKSFLKELDDNYFPEQNIIEKDDNLTIY